jgi:membrane protease subunit (stomatin/prohibitin family)
MGLRKKKLLEGETRHIANSCAQHQVQQRQQQGRKQQLAGLQSDVSTWRSYSQALRRQHQHQQQQQYQQRQGQEKTRAGCSPVA